MKCNSCGSTNATDARFCSNCGTQLAQVCPKCQAEFKKGDKFCKNCGEPLQKSQKKSSSKKTAQPIASPPEGLQEAKKKKKIPIWLLIVIGIVLIICILVAIFGEISFNIGAPAATTTPMVPSATITPIIVATATQKVTPTLETSPAPAYEIGVFNPFCNQETGEIQFLYEHQPVRVEDLTWLDEAELDPFVQEYMDRTQFNVNFDGEEIAPLMVFYKPVFDETTDVYKLRMGFDADPLPLGIHLSDSVITWSEQLTFPESMGGITVGPGTEIEQIPFKCALMVGAPDASWDVIAESDFSTDKGIFGSEEIVVNSLKRSIQETKNGLVELRLEPDKSEDENYGYEHFLYLNNIPYLKDFILSFDMEIKHGDENQSYDIFFRQNDLSNSYYGLEVNPNKQEIKFYAVLPENYGEKQELVTSQIPFMNPTGKNRITFMANGSTFMYWVNDQYVYMLEDNTIQEKGYTGFRFLLDGYGERVFELDNLLLRAPIS
jgi:hypothetical protein